MSTRRRANVLARGGDVADLSSRLRFRRAVRLCAMSVVAPGSAQIAVGHRWIGRIALTLWVLLLVGLGYVLWTYRDDRAGLIGMATDTDVLNGVRIGVVVVALAWCALFIDAWRLAQPLRLTPLRAGVVLLLNTVLVVGVLGSAVYATRVTTAGHDAVKQVFTAETTSAPRSGRYNILLIGSDSGKDRTGIRPDSLTVASIDVSTGRTVLISLPRNLQNVPFRENSPMHQLYPYGYNCGSECLINAVHTAAEGRSDLYPDAEDPGLEATIDAVEGATDLTINYYVMINLKGFSSLVDAVDGVEMDVKTRLAMFGKEDAWKQEYIEPGRQVLNGRQALWYARSRVQSDDYTRMGRQKCLMATMLDQLSPQKVLLNATDIAKSGAELISTDMPASELGEFADLALKARETKIRTVSLVPPLISTVTPDFEQIHRLIKEAIIATHGGDANKGDTLVTPEPSNTPSPDPTDEVDDTLPPDVSQASANNAEDLDAAC